MGEQEELSKKNVVNRFIKKNEMQETVRIN